MANRRRRRKSNAAKLNTIMLLLTFILICLIVFCLVYTDSTPEDTPVETTTAPSTTVQKETLPTVIVTVPETTMETTEATTVPTTEATTVPTTEPETIPETDPDIGATAAMVAKQQVGKPYQYGEAGPDMFDTSGLLHYCYAQAGVSIPRSNKGLAEFGYIVDKADIRPGDAVFFWSNEPGTADWPGIYVGDGIVIAAMNQSKPVVEFNMNSPYYTEHFVFVRRFY